MSYSRQEPWPSVRIALLRCLTLQQLTTANVPEETGSVNEVAKHDGAGDTAEQPDDDVLEADGKRPLLVPHSAQSGHRAGHRHPECEEDEDEHDDEEGNEVAAVVVTVLSKGVGGLCDAGTGCEVVVT